MDTPVSSDNMGCKLFVGGVPIKIEENQLFRHFERFGHVKFLKLGRHKKTLEVLGFAFVEYENEDAAARALASEHFIDDREIDVKPFGLDRDIEKQQEDALKKKVYVKGLPEACTKNTLLTSFEKFGEVTRAFILYNHKNCTSRGFGFIEFANESSVALCLGKTITIEGKDLLISKALERTKKKRIQAKKMKLAESEANQNSSLKLINDHVTDKATCTSGSTPETCKSTKKFTFDSTSKKNHTASWLETAAQQNKVDSMAKSSRKKQSVKSSKKQAKNSISMAIGSKVNTTEPQKLLKFASSISQHHSSALFMSFRSRLAASEPDKPMQNHSCEFVRFNIQVKV